MSAPNTTQPANDFRANWLFKNEMQEKYGADLVIMKMMPNQKYKTGRQKYAAYFLTKTGENTYKLINKHNSMMITNTKGVTYPVISINPSTNFLVGEETTIVGEASGMPIIPRQY
jgi:hypothetical protein